jgi:hypothetical protein
LSQKEPCLHELKKSKVIKNEKLLFETTANFLKTQGVILKSGEEITKEQYEKVGNLYY